jgi:hypothetical protein
LPFDGPIESCPPVRQNTVDTAFVYSFFGQEISELPLFLRRNVGDGRFRSPKLLPVSKAIPSRGCARQFLRMLKPIIEQHSLNADLIAACVAGILVVFDNPSG